MGATRFDILLLFLRVDEHSSDCYIGRNNFCLVFSGKVKKFIEAYIYSFAVWLLISL